MESWLRIEQNPLPNPTLPDGIIVVQTREVQVMYGEGRLLMQVHFATTVGGAGHRAPHWELLQSWVRRTDEDERILISDLPSGVSQAYEANPRRVGQRRLREFLRRLAHGHGRR